MYLFGNVTVFCTRDGKVVPGSERVGHNLMTNYGQKEWLSKLVGCSALGSGSNDDVAITNARVRWIGLGIRDPGGDPGERGWQPETRHVKFLSHPVLVDTGVYLAEIVPATETFWPVATAFKIEHTFDCSFFAATTEYVSELGLYTGYQTGGLFYPVWEGTTRMDPASDNNPVSFYKYLDPPVAVTNTDSLTVRWELRY